MQQLDHAAAREAANARRVEIEAMGLRKDFADDEHWQDLAKDRGLRLPQWNNPVEPTQMRRWLRRLNVKPSVYLNLTGLERLEQFQELNPKCPLRAWVGLLLEYADEVDNAKAILTKSL